MLADAILKPVQPLGPHVAALGVHVYSGTMFPRAYDRSLFVAEHGSWRLKRKDDIGHRVIWPNFCCGPQQQLLKGHEVFLRR